ncbi:MAG: hypothetical protein NC433_11575 [Clostridiales bacterium]|nr:hypothetical protein [Clostridiales bacterium]
MKIEVDDNNIFIVDENTDNHHVIMKKPNVDDYSNVTVRPLVVNYHLMKETIWARSCSFMRKLQENCGDSPYLICYCLLFEQLYPTLLSSSQAKNIIGYGMNEKEHVSEEIHSFMTFLQENSSFILLPEKSFVFSTLLNKSCHAAIFSLDRCTELPIIYDTISKIRCGGKLFLYTKSNNVPNELAELINYASISSFGSSAVYSITIDTAISAFACENNSEANMMQYVVNVLGVLAELKKLTLTIEKNPECPPDVYMTAVELLYQIEKSLINLYDVLENPELSVLANLFKEALMDYYIAATNQLDIGTYFNRLWKEARIFYEKMEIEFEP